VTHDKYLVITDNAGIKDRKTQGSKGAFSAKPHLRSKSNGDFNKTANNFSKKSTFAQKLDNFISNK
jgi:hypothetical protein